MNWVRSLFGLEESPPSSLSEPLLVDESHRTHDEWIRKNFTVGQRALFVHICASLTGTICHVDLSEVVFNYRQLTDLVWHISHRFPNHNPSLTVVRFGGRRLIRLSVGSVQHIFIWPQRGCPQ